MESFNPMRFKNVFLMLAAISLTACEDLAVHFTPKKQAVSSHSKLAMQAQNNFWDTLHHGQYQRIPEVNRLLMAAYLQNPNDPRLAAHLGFMHMWKITEREREKNIPPGIVNEIVLARNYFSDAVELDPKDARYVGFYGDSQLVTGKIFNDEREQVRGYFTLRHAITMWPEFNYFTAGYVMTVLSPTSKQFKQALAWQWKTLDLCAGEKVNRKQPDFSPYMKRETQQGPLRACWNSEIAPFNYEGFFMNMGDMLVKSGDWQTALPIYKNARLDKNYASWPYRSMLEKRIAQAEENVANFQKEYTNPEKTIMFNSGYGCVACHQQATIRHPK